MFRRFNEVIITEHALSRARERQVPHHVVRKVASECGGQDGIYCRKLSDGRTVAVEVIEAEVATVYGLNETFDPALDYRFRR